jgi:hypothetical protein
MRNGDEAAPEEAARAAAMIAPRSSARLLILHFTFLWWGGGRKVLKTSAPACYSTISIEEAGASAHLAQMSYLFLAHMG